jgi:N-acetylglucosaminyldiphosphoundecaprenol N-acetyl-beta-D-mannosaminyltransferase
MNSNVLDLPKTAVSRNGNSKISILGVQIDNVTRLEALDRMEALLHSADGPHQVCFAYANCLNRAYSDPRYREVLNHSKLVLPDGTGVRIASSVLGSPVRENQCGTDVIPSFLGRINGHGARVFLLGSKQATVQQASEKMKREFPSVTVCGVQHGYFQSDEEVIGKINAAKPDILLVGLGVPRQETWIAENLPRLNAKVCCGVGAFFDFYSGVMPRAPQWMLSAGMEWIYRLYCEPKRLWRRYLVGNFLFLGRIYRQLLTGRAVRA